MGDKILFLAESARIIELMNAIDEVSMKLMRLLRDTASQEGRHIYIQLLMHLEKDRNYIRQRMINLNDDLRKEILR